MPTMKAWTRTIWIAWLLVLGGLWGCAEELGPDVEEPLDTPPIEDDLVSPTPGGKYDTGYLSTLASELEANFAGTVRIDVSNLTPEEREAELQRLTADTWSVRRLVDRQVKFAKNQINGEQLHLNLSSSDLTLSESELTESGHIVIHYTTTVETLVSHEELAEAGTSIEAVLNSEFTAVVPDQPDRMASAVGAACLEEEHSDAQDYNYFYYYAPEREGCAEAMTGAGIERVEARLTVRNLAPSKTVFPEYDQLVADGRIDVVVFFGAADHDWEPGEWDWGTYQRDNLARDLRNRGFELVDSEEGDLYRRTVGELVENVRIIGPETLKLLRDDSDGLFRRHVSASEIVFYNGHSFYGSLGVLDDDELYPGHYQIFFMNSCWSYEYYTKQIFSHNATEADPDGWLLADVVNDTESGWFHNMGAMSRILLTNLLKGAETGGVEGDRYYTWDRIIGAMNEEAISSQSSRGSKSHEIYGVSGVRTNRFDPTGTTPPNPDADRFEAAPGLAIPDNDPDGVGHDIEVPADHGAIQSVKVEVEIEHTYIGDLTVELHHGDRYFTLHSRDGGSTDDLSISLSTDHFSGMDGGGTWTLKVVDHAHLDEGQLVRWAIEL
jgi:hypothetical protein